MLKTDIWKKYQKLGIIGSGALGNMYKAKYNDQYFAIKEIKKNKLDENQFFPETEVMKTMECDNSVKIIESIETQESFYIISELCHLNIEQYLKKRKKGLSIEEIKELLIDLNKGLKVMYEKKVIHGDIKPSNILLSLNKNNVNKICLKISDFGLSKLYEKIFLSKNLKDRAQFISPKCLKSEKNEKNDIVYLGINIYYLLFKNYPSNGQTNRIQ